MPWRPSQPFALARRRGLGQILLASRRVYRENPRLYLTIGVLFVPVSLVIAGIQKLLFDATRLEALPDVAGQTNAAVVGVALAIGLILMPLAPHDRAGDGGVIADVRRERARAPAAHRLRDDQGSASGR